MGESPGGWHLWPSPQALGSLQEAPLPSQPSGHGGSPEAGGWAQ